MTCLLPRLLKPDKLERLALPLGPWPATCPRLAHHPQPPAEPGPRLLCMPALALLLLSPPHLPPHLSCCPSPSPLCSWASFMSGRAYQNYPSDAYIDPKQPYKAQEMYFGENLCRLVAVKNK